MAEIVMLGAELDGLAAGMLLARDGHRVRVLERDPGQQVDQGPDGVPLRRPSPGLLPLGMTRW